MALRNASSKLTPLIRHLEVLPAEARRQSAIQPKACSRQTKLRDLSDLK